MSKKYADLIDAISRLHLVWFVHGYQAETTSAHLNGLFEVFQECEPGLFNSNIKKGLAEVRRE